MQYIIKSKEVSRELEQVLNHVKHTVNRLSDNTLEINVTEEQQEDFYLIVSFVISYHSFKKIIRDELNRRKVESRIAEPFFQNACQYFQSSKYWIGLTNVSIVDFFSSRQELNADTFATFNMKGFKKEILSYVENVLFHQEELSYLPNELNPDYQEDITPIQLDDGFAIMRKALIDNNISTNTFKTLHVKRNGEGFIVEDSNGRVLDETFFLEELGMVIEATLDGEVPPPLARSVFQLICLCGILEPNQVMVHKGLGTSAIEAVSENHEAFTENTEKVITFVFCEGCAKCDKD